MCDAKQNEYRPLEVFHVLVKVPGDQPPDGRIASSDTMLHFVALAESEENAVRLVKSDRDTFPGMTYSVKAATVLFRAPDDNPRAEWEQLYRI